MPQPWDEAKGSELKANSYFAFYQSEIICLTHSDYVSSNSRRSFVIRSV